MPPKILQSHQTTRKMSDWELACLARFNKREEEYQEAALLNKLGRNLATCSSVLGLGGGRCGHYCLPLTLYCTQRCALEHWCEHKKVCKESPEKDRRLDLSGGRCANCGDEFTFLWKLQGPPRVALIMATERQLFNATPVVPMFCDDDSDDDTHECFVIDKILARAIKIQSIIRMFLQRKDYLEILSLKPGGIGYLDVKKEFNSLVNATRKVPAAVVPKEDTRAPLGVRTRTTALPWALLLAWYAVPAASKLITEFFDLWPR